MNIKPIRIQRSGRRFAGCLLLLLLVFGAVVQVQAVPGSANGMVKTGQHQTAIFAGGCFWCIESDFDKVKGVVDTLSGYMGGHVKKPTYKQVSAGGSGHVEVVKIIFDPSVVSYEKLLDIFWHNIDPTVLDRQFCDQGRQYRSAIFYLNQQQKKLAQQSKEALEKSKPFSDPIVTEIAAAVTFHVAEDYHQNYHQRNPLRYKYYRYSCGRDQRLEELWGQSG